MEYIYQIAIEVHSDGSIDLEQPYGCGEVASITIHQSQVRYLFEKSGHLLPPILPGELSKCLARQMRDVHAALINGRESSQGIDEAITKLSAYIDALPESLSDPAPDKALKAESQPCQNEQGERPDFQLTQPKE